MSLSIAEWLDYSAALTYVKSTLTATERRALARVRFQASGDITALRGYFYGVQARRDRRFVDRIDETSAADGLVKIFVRSHPRGDLAELAVTVHHEIDHALGFNEVQVDLLARQRGPISDLAVEDWRPMVRAGRIVVPTPRPAPERPARARPFVVP
jgi:hypothetical protein